MTTTDSGRTSNAATMRAAVVRADGGIEAGRIPRPECGTGQVRVAIEACGLCGSDLHAFRRREWRPGLVPGHEIHGRLEAVGPDTSDAVARRGLALGSAVTVEPLETCRRCTPCSDGLPAQCPELELAGIHRAGGFAESIIASVDRVYPIAPEIEKHVATLCEPIAVVLRGLDRGAFRQGERVLVLGAGTVGLLAGFAARVAGASEVVVRARYAHQRALAEDSLGLVAVDANEALRDGPLESRFDLVLETVGGSSETLVEAGLAARPGGRVVILGLFEPNPPLDPMQALTKELSFHFSNCYASPPNEACDFDRAAGFLATHHTHLRDLVTHRFPLDEIEHAFRVAGHKEEGACKVVVMT